MYCYEVITGTGRRLCNSEACHLYSYLGKFYIKQSSFECQTKTRDSLPNYTFHIAHNRLLRNLFVK